jgi:hypothetical protein
MRRMKVGKVSFSLLVPCHWFGHNTRKERGGRDVQCSYVFKYPCKVESLMSSVVVGGRECLSHHDLVVNDKF